MKFHLLLLVSILCFSNITLAQNDDAPSVASSEKQSKEVQKKTNKPQTLTQTERLAELARIINEEEIALASLRKQENQQDADPELARRIEDKTENLRVVNKSFEQIAVKGISLEVFEQEEVPETWQEELTLVVKPLLENLRGLTEKPRRRETLKQTIILEKSAAQTAHLALQSIKESIKEASEEEVVNNQLSKIQEKWQRLLTEAERKQELASIELSNLEGDNANWFDSFKTSIKTFAQQRGLTLLIALCVAFLVILFFKLLTRFIELRRKDKSSTNRTTYRVIAYAQKLLTILFVVIGILIVFFIRGDVLLLALMSILILASALGLRHFIPQFIEESRILLNIGRVREHELVVINNVPWRVASINVFSKLVNPEIKGVLRLPLEDMKNLLSRRIGDENWFPSSIGDWMLDSDDRLYEVINQGPDAVELQSAQKTSKIIPTGDYYTSGILNLTKSKTIRITSVFGVDYNLQSISLDEVPEKMQAAVQRHLEAMELDTDDINTKVEFRAAGSSSLDYIVIVNINSAAAKHYFRIQRYIQQACVQICNQEGWGIPFPQITINKPAD